MQLAFQAAPATSHALVVQDPPCPERKELQVRRVPTTAASAHLRSCAQIAEKTQRERVPMRFHQMLPAFDCALPPIAKSFQYRLYQALAIPFALQWLRPVEQTIHPLQEYR